MSTFDELWQNSGDISYVEALRFWEGGYDAATAAAERETADYAAARVAEIDRLRAALERITESFVVSNIHTAREALEPTDKRHLPQQGRGSGE